MHRPRQPVATPAAFRTHVTGMQTAVSRGGPASAQDVSAAVRCPQCAMQWQQATEGECGGQCAFRSACGEMACGTPEGPVLALYFEKILEKILEKFGSAQGIRCRGAQTLCAARCVALAKAEVLRTATKTVRMRSFHVAAGLCPAPARPGGAPAYACPAHSSGSGIFYFTVESSVAIFVSFVINMFVVGVFAASALWGPECGSNQELGMPPDVMGVLGPPCKRHLRRGGRVPSSFARWIGAMHRGGGRIAQAGPWGESGKTSLVPGGGGGGHCTSRAMDIGRMMLILSQKNKAPFIFNLECSMRPVPLVVMKGQGICVSEA